jgi:hypothetical protein
VSWIAACAVALVATNVTTNVTDTGAHFFVTVAANGATTGKTRAVLFKVFL